MNSSTVLPIASSQIGSGLECSEAEFASSGLTSIPIEEWLSRAKLATPDLKLGGNLFYRQTVYGRQLISSNFRKAVALKSSAGETLCSACIQVLDPTPDGTLRIRGVTTEPPFRNRGYATDLLVRLTTALRSSPTICSQFAKVEVWAAPEMVKAFSAAGFLLDNHRSPRSEPLYIPSENTLVSSDRILQPMFLSLR